MSITNDTFKRALARLAAGVSVVSTALDGDRRGVTATAVCSVSAEPPTILACVNTATGTFKMIEQTRRFAVNLLAEHHRPVAEAFAGRGGQQGDERFQHGDWLEGEHLAVPILATALSALECEVTQVVIAGTHGVVFGAVRNIYFADKPPLIYHDGQFHVLPGSKALQRTLETQG
ncbi:flavin reductase family protein [Caulobacter sp. SSI4214]|uniref:flavin reductase family protein n=1 Tax=Caulobacter sp. SSI4214 TaxID=2575739 RepID=UPI00143B34C7|nr:flavin reductase family protein [Caulobacter sp. SSI4214]